jgi:hypothetical protein
LNSSAPIECREGSYTATEGNDKCDLCPVSTYQNETGKSGCDSCFDGTFCPEGTTTPPCKAGDYRNLTDYQCYPAWLGYFAPLGSTVPKPCPAGAFAGALGHDDCPLCPAGKFQTSRGQSACNECLLGEYCPEVRTAHPHVSDSLPMHICAHVLVADQQRSSVCDSCAFGPLDVGRVLSLVHLACQVRLVHFQVRMYWGFVASLTA